MFLSLFVFSAFFGFQYKQYKSLTTHNIPKIMQNYRTSSEEKKLVWQRDVGGASILSETLVFSCFFRFLFLFDFFVFSVRPCRLSKDISQQFCISPSILKPLHRFKVCFQSYILLYMPCAAVSFKWYDIPCIKWHRSVQSLYVKECISLK